MIAKEDLYEVRNRDFLEIVDHYHDFDHVQTELILGQVEESTFLTIILPVYNHPQELIERAINSVLNQCCSFKYKLLVIDDYAKESGATETEKYLRKLQDKRIVYYKNRQNLGVFGNWNRAILLSNSQWVSFLHSDDFLKDNYLENMYTIVSQNEHIDQLACNYKMLDFSKCEIDVEQEYKGMSGKRCVRKVKDCEYLYEMITSVKGSFYRREKLIEIGGFRSQGDGIGLDDYPLMLKFAHYYNTFLLEDVLYLNTWGHNDSLNIKHWYPELVENYYMWRYFAKKEGRVFRKIYEEHARHMLIKRAIQYKNGTSWVGVPIPIDYEELKSDCELKSIKFNWIYCKAISGIIKIIQFCRKYPMTKYNYLVKTNSDRKCKLS